MGRSSIEQVAAARAWAGFPGLAGLSHLGAGPAVVWGMPR